MAKTLRKNEFDGKLNLEALTTKNWGVFEKLMGEKGGCGGCWCMSFRQSTAMQNENKFDGNKQLQKENVANKKHIGLIAFVEEEPIAWIALAPREDFVKIENARSLKRIDDKPVWSIPCFFIKKEFRRMGLSSKLIAGVIDYAKSKKIKTLEAYPAIPYDAKMPDAFLWIGVLSAFEKNGFKIVRQNGKSKAMVRLEI